MATTDYSKVIGPMVTLGAVGAVSRTARGVATGPTRKRKAAPKRRKVTVTKRKKAVSPKPKIKKRIIKATTKKRKSRRKTK